MTDDSKIKQNLNAHYASLKLKEDLSSYIQRLLDQEARVIQPHQEKTEKINLGQGEDKKEVLIDTKIEEEVKGQLVKLLKEYVDIFGWSYHDMPRLDPEIIEHKLPIKEESHPVKLDIGFLVVSCYLEWLSNIVTLLKKSKKVRVCIDYRDLNRASPKYDFPLPHIDMLMDNISTNTIFSFTDGYSVKGLMTDEEADSHPWYFDIQQYIEGGKYPVKASDNDKKRIRRRAIKFSSHRGVLYKKRFNSILLRCVDHKEAQSLMKEIHEGTFGTHMTGHTMVRKILRAGYFWSTMERDCILYARKFRKCQIYVDNIQVPPNELNVMTSPWSFSMWGMDIIGPIKLKASIGHRFILIAIDYFTKWVEAMSYAHVTRKVVVNFVRRNIVYRYGIPNKIITDNRSNLNNKMMTKLYDSFKIQHHNSSPYKPKMNGAVEAANKNIKKIVQKMVVTYKNTSTTLFSLIYGIEAVLSVEVEIPSLRMLMEVKLPESEWVQSRLDQLNLIEEKRLDVICHGQNYQQRIKKAFDKKYHPQHFQEGDLMLKKLLPAQKEKIRKWTLNYEGPYVVKRTLMEI
uniref:Gypsy retrotransposon integrase-like protein 1 n=1 Tax=Cajanus cajan TaxID=3821 RepID=A0A151QYS5_CAJCA|nr:Gypsy retrotransposon integrase-like protein 1 [Cajanus cajan]